MLSARPSCKAFTLTELLIALAILGMIATFAIPKVLQAQQNSAWNSAAKEVASMLSEAYQAYRLTHQVDANTDKSVLSPYFNYVKIDSTSWVDTINNTANTNCAWKICLVLHNGGILHYSNFPFGGTSSTNALSFQFDPDGVDSGTTNGPGKSVRFWIYTNGQVRTDGTIESNTYGNGASQGNPTPSNDPDWFRWN